MFGLGKNEPEAAVEEGVPPEYEVEVEKESTTDEKEVDAVNPMQTYMRMAIKGALMVLLVVYLLAAFIIDFKRAQFLFVCTILVIAYYVAKFLGTKKYPEELSALEANIIGVMEKCETERVPGLTMLALVLAIMVILAAVSVRDAYNLVSLFGLVVYVLLTWAFSYKPTAVKWRPVIGAIFIQYLFGYVVIKTTWGFNAITFLANQVTYLLNYTYAGSGFVYGFLVDGSLFGKQFSTTDGGSYGIYPPLFFNVLPTVIFFSALISICYYLNILQNIVKTFGYFLSIVLGTSASESLSAAANVFVGQTEAPLVVKPFLKEMTPSEIHAIMTGGFATIAGGVLAIYISFGVEPTALLAASVMSAPAALAISKVAYPETETSKTDYKLKNSWILPESEDQNIVHAASTGAVTGSMLMLNIASNLIAALAIIKMLDVWLWYFGERVDIPLSFDIICEVIFYPFVWLLGVEPGDLRIAAKLVGLKVFANEFVAYEFLAFTYRDSLSARSYYIMSYALCGFSNFGSVGIQLGGITPLAPEQGPVLSKLVMSAMIAGNTACFMTACIAGFFYTEK